MKRLKRTAVMVVALFAGTGLATAAEAGKREWGGGHGADRVTQRLFVGGLDHKRHDVRHDRHRERGHGHGHRRHDAGSRHDHYRHRGKHHGRHYFRPHRGYAPHRSYRHRYRQHGYRYYGYGISFELDGLRYYLGGYDYR